jgi:hypothetical protein
MTLPETDSLPILKSTLTLQNLIMELASQLCTIKKSYNTNSRQLQTYLLLKTLQFMKQ